jgi:hypothetical protein
MKGTPPPPSRYPTLAKGQLAEANKAAIGFPTLPGLRATAPEPGFIMPVHDYDWGPQFNAVDGSGIASKAPPPIRQSLKMLARRSTPMATKSAAYRWCCSTRRSEPILAGTSRPAAFTRDRSATTPAG